MSILSIAGTSRPEDGPGNSDADGAGKCAGACDGDGNGGNDGNDTDTTNSPFFQNALHEAPCIKPVSLARLKASRGGRSRKAHVHAGLGSSWSHLGTGSTALKNREMVSETRPLSSSRTPITAECSRRADERISRASDASDTSSAAMDSSAGAGIDESMSAITLSIVSSMLSIWLPIPSRSVMRPVWTPRASSSAAAADSASIVHSALSPERATCSMQDASPGQSSASAKDMMISAAAPTSGSRWSLDRNASADRPAP